MIPVAPVSFTLAVRKPWCGNHPATLVLTPLRGLHLLQRDPGDVSLRGAASSSP